MSDTNTPEGWTPVMPLIACRTNGGVYDDNSYVAGWELGALFQILYMSHVRSMALSIHEGNVAQCDLVAMHHGMTLKVWGESDGWANVELRRVDENDVA